MPEGSSKNSIPAHLHIAVGAVQRGIRHSRSDDAGAISCRRRLSGSNGRKVALLMGHRKHSNCRARSGYRRRRSRTGYGYAMPHQEMLTPPLQEMLALLLVVLQESVGGVKLPR